MIRACLLSCWIAFAVPAGFAAGQPPASAVRYTLTFPEADRHLVDVEALVPTSGRNEVVVMMPVWTPGSYLVREYARHVQTVSAHGLVDGNALPITKTSKNRWSIQCAPGTEFVRINYRLYCREMSVRTNWVERDFGVLTGAATFVTLAEDPVPVRPHHVRVVLASQWRAAVSPMKSATDDPHTFVAESFDELVDSPIVVGSPAIATFEVDGIPHRLVTLNGEGLWDNEAAAADVRRIVETQRDFWGKLPYERYTFLNVVGEAGGGLEHDNGTLLMTSRWSYRDPDAYRRWLGLVSHELFHAWNVRRLRPMKLMRYDYENENYFDELWIAEGITTYYDDLLQRRAGLLTKDDYLKRVSETLHRVMTSPGNMTQSLHESSHDAWIKFYRPDENDVNARVSYYTKGAIVAWVLDTKIRQATNNARSLDDVMRMLFERHRNSGYSFADFQRITDEVAGQPLSQSLAEMVAQPGLLDVSILTEFWGLGIGNAQDKKPVEAEDQTAEPESAVTPPTAGQTSEPTEADAAAQEEFGNAVRPPNLQPLAPSATAKGEKTPFVGATLKDTGGRMMVTQVVRGTPADLAGWNVDDELIAINGFRVDDRFWSDRLKQFPVGQSLPCLLSRRGQLIDRPLTLQPNLGEPWKIRLINDDAPAHAERLNSWWGNWSE